jgi:hypothetical protein
MSTIVFDKVLDSMLVSEHTTIPLYAYQKGVLKCYLLVA